MKSVTKLLFLAFFILLVSHIVYWKDYWKPQGFFWDENYHIASAAKYLRGTFFMEPHPPLGKLMLALGEQLLQINNAATFGYEKFDIIPHQMLNESFSFAGFRFFPALFAIANVLLFSGIAYWLTTSYILTAAFCFLPILDTALVLHSRGAMIDSFLLFGHLLSIFFFFILLKYRRSENASTGEKFGLIASGFGMAFGLFFASMTKLFGLALLVLWPLLYIFRSDLRSHFKKFFPLQFIMVFIFSLAIWFVHIEYGKKIEPTLINRGEYFISSDYEKWLLGIEPDSIAHFPQKLWEHFRYIVFFEENVAATDWTDPLVTGSYPITWPLGSRPIPYRWEKKNGQHRYLYLVPNPWAWGAGLAGLVLSIFLWVRRGKKLLTESPEIVSMIALYFGYFIPMCFIPRVLYLYHYFPLLFISWILLILFIKQAQLVMSEIWKKRLQIALCVFPIFIFQGYYSMRNFVYFSGVECSDLEKKHFPPFWGMRFQTCVDEKNNQRFIKQNKEVQP
jgi:dolichyl-phosphate-mannose-protein mannosyltransferase